MIWQPGIEKPGQSIYFDFGAIKKIALLKKNASEHSIGIGSSIANLNYAKMTVKYNGSKSESSLPVITRYGINYQLMLDKHLLIDTLKTIKLLAQGEYQKVLNSKYESAIRSGAEVMVLELLSLRIGYYKEKEYNYGYSNVNKSEISSITYGVGVQIPLHKLTKVPLNISFDYTKLPQPNYSLIYSQLGNFTTYNLRLNWILKSRK